MTRHFAIGQRVTLRPDRADAYNVPRGTVYTVLTTKPHTRYKRTWVYLAELPAPENVVDSRELRAAVPVGACPRCGRIADGWPLRRADVCAPKGWVSCIRNL